MFKWFSDLRIRNKLLVTFLLMIGLTGLVSAVAIITQNNMNTAVDALVDIDTKKAQLALETDTAMLMARRGEKDYLLRYKDLGFDEARNTYVTQVQTEVAKVHANLAEIKRLQVREDHNADLAAADQSIAEYEADFLAVVKLIEQKGYKDSGLEGRFRDKVHAIEDAVDEEGMERLTVDMLTIRRHEKDYLLRGEEQYITQVHEAVAQLKTDVAASDVSQAKKENLVKLADEYQELFDQVVQIDTEIAAGIETYRATVHTLEPMLDKVHATAMEEQDATRTAMENSVWLAANTMIAVSLAAAIIGLVIAFFLARSIARAVNNVAQVAEGIAGGDLGQFIEVKSKDELGQMAAAFQRMIFNLRELIGRVQQSANQVAGASQQLSLAAEQASLASQQVASTTQQMAEGANQQTQSVTEATGSVEQVARAAEGIARGAQEQAAGIQKMSDLVNEMGKNIDAVAQTGQSLETIRNRTAIATEKVKEMSTRSKEIGRIVETIGDIADKTDMLALNAAVEAARAGEHGRGFAVVADQVRKLSEDSKVATRNIDDLIERVQEAVNQAIAAMENTAAEVEKGTKRIDEAVGQLKEKSDEVLPTIETVSAVVEENTASTEEMAANTQEITSTMEGVASIAEENGAAAEEVSASAEEMSAQVEEVVASAEELSALAEELRVATTQFRVEQGRLEPERQKKQKESVSVPASEQLAEPEPVLVENGRKVKLQ